MSELATLSFHLICVSEGGTEQKNNTNYNFLLLDVVKGN
jgi:hypothetical protein